MATVLICDVCRRLQNSVGPATKAVAVQKMTLTADGILPIKLDICMECSDRIFAEVQRQVAPVVAGDVIK